MNDGALLRTLGLAVLVEEEGALTWHAPAPPWWSAVFGERQPGESHFLAAFLDEADAHWRSGEEIALPSGIWEETGTDGETHHLRASALSADGTSFLVIESLDRHGPSNPFGLQQRLHEGALERRQLQREVQKKSVLLDCVVHDLSGPLSTIMVNLQHLRKLTDDDDIRWSVDIAISEAERQRKLIHFISDLFSTDLRSLLGHHADPADAPDIAAITRAIADAHRESARQRSVAIDVACEIPPETRVAGEREHLARVIENLLANALRHSPSTGRIAVRVASEGGKATFEIRDEGHGVDPEVAERVFEPRVRGTATGGKAGLGLHFCRSTIHLWGGDIGFENTEHGGARFWFQLPVVGPTES